MAGLCPDPLGQLTVLPRPPSCIEGQTKHFQTKGSGGAYSAPPDPLAALKMRLQSLILGAYSTSPHAFGARRLSIPVLLFSHSNTDLDDIVLAY